MIYFVKLRSQTDLNHAFKNNLKAFSKAVNSSKFDSARYYLSINQKLAKNSADPNFENLYYLQAAELYISIDSLEDALKYAKKSILFFKQKGDLKNYIDCGFVISKYYYDRSVFDSVIKFCDLYIPIALKNNYTKNYSYFLFIKGRSLVNKGNNAKATVIYEELLKFAESNKDSLFIYHALVGFAAIYEDFNPNTAISYLNKALKYVTKTSRTPVSNLYTIFGNTYRNKDMLDSALYFYNMNLKYLDKNKDIILYGATIGNIGNLLNDLGQYDEALKKQFESLTYFKQAGDSVDIEIAYGTIADIYLKSGKTKEALQYYIMAINMSHRLGFMEELIYNYEGLFKCYEKSGNYMEAHNAYKKYILYKDSVKSVAMAKKLTEQEMSFKFENQRKEEALIQKSKDLVTEARIRAQKITIYSAIFGGIILLVFLFITLRNSNIRKKINAQLKLSHAEINAQKNIIEVKNREITDSITYSARIQQGILPDEEEIKSLLPNSFMFFRPRDIVSGDFYWMKKITGSSKIGFDDLIAVVIADCTGHGVPGAFMSFIGSTIFNQTIHNKLVETPADALNYLNKQLPSVLKSKSNTGQINDGMEAGICVFNKTNNKLFYAGANISLIHIRNGKAQETKGDKHSIGLNADQQKSFTNHEIQLEKNDCIYMFSDGYADQFGGPKGKKFKYKNLISLLENNSDNSTEHQHKNISENFDNWKGQLEQLDDVLLFGMKV